MQNLFVKSLVLGSVIGSSCLVVWKAHDGLKSAADKVNPSEFVALDGGNSASGSAETKPKTEKGADDWGAPLKLTDSSEDPVPTLAMAPVQAESAELPSRSPASAAPQQEEKEEHEGALPLFFKESPKTSPVASAPDMPLLPVADKARNENKEDSDPFAAAPAQSESVPDLARKGTPASQEFVELPGQQVEGMPNAAASILGLPQPEPLPTPAAGFPPAQSEGPDLPGSPLNGLSQANAEMNSKSVTAREMPGLTKLDGPMAAPVLLQVDPREPLAIPARKDPEVMSAAGMQPELPMIQKTSGSLSLPAPGENIEEAANATSPKQLPRLEDMLKGPKKGASPVEIAEADPFGGSRMTAAAPTPAREIPVEPLPTVRSSPGLFPDESRLSPPASAEPLPAARPSRDAPVLPESTPVLPDSAAPAMPPLPPNSEILPDPLPAASPLPTAAPASTSTVPPQGLEFPAATTPTPSPARDVMPFPAAPVQPTPNRELPSQSELSAPDPFGLPAGAKPAPASPAGEVLPDTQPALPPVKPVNPLNSSSPVPTPVPASLPPVTPSPVPAALPAMTPAPAAPVGNPAGTATPNLLIGTGDLDSNAPQGPQSPELKIEKIAPAEAEVGEPVVYAILIRNVGGSTAKDVVVEDRIPRGTQLEGTIPQAYLNDGKLSWQLGTIEPGAERKIQLKVVPMEAGQIGSVATVSFAAAVSATIKVNSPKLSISMSGPQEAAIGEPMNFHFKLKNSGQSTAKSVFLRAVLPVGLTHPGGNDLEYESGMIGPGEEKDVHLVVQAEKEGRYVINAQVTNDGRAHAETQAAMNIIKSRLEISRTGTESRFVGRSAPFVLRVTNTSTDELRGVTLQETVPPAVELSAVPAGAQWDVRSRLLTWRLEQLRPGEFRELNVAYTPRTAGDHRGTLVAMDGAGNKSTLETVLSAKGFSELTPHYQIDQRTVMVNERVTLQVTLENAGTAASRNVRAQFILPEGVEFISAQGPGEFKSTGHQVVFAPLGEFTPGSKETFHLAVIPHQEGTAKVTFKLEADDYTDPVFQDQAIRVVPAGR